MIAGLKMYRTALPIIFFLFQMSCAPLNNASIEKSRDGSMELVVRDNYSGLIEEELLVIREQKSLLAFFSKINKTRKPGLSIPVVDFTKDMLVIWCSGETQNPNTGLKIKKETSKRYILSKRNPNTKAYNSAIISPFIVYKLPLSNRGIVIE